MQPATIQPATVLARASDLQAALAELYATPTNPIQVMLANPAQVYKALLLAGPLVADCALLEYTPLAEFATAPGVHAVNTADLAATEAALQQGVRWLLTTPLQQPYLTMPDLGALAALCERYGCTLIIDQTLTPLLETVPELTGAALHHNLNLLTGLPDLTGEVAALCLPLHALLPTLGLSILGPGLPYPASGLETLALRLRTHSGNAQAIADVLAGHPGVRAVYHPGLGTHPQFEYAEMHSEQGSGGMVYANIPAPHFAQRLRSWLQGQQAWGGPHSAVWSVPQRPTLYGLWAGLEDIDDLLTELEGALV